MGVAPLEEYLAELGEVFAVFNLQDSGNVSYGVRRADGARVFVKHSTTEAAAANVARAVRFHNEVKHPAIPDLLEVMLCEDGPALVFDWAEGEVLAKAMPKGVARVERFRALLRLQARPLAEVLAVVDTVFDVHVEVERQGWVAVDLYDGCILWDDASGATHVIDFEVYEPGPFVNTMGRMWGATRFMPHEELTLGAPIDHRTNVFVLGRIALQLLSKGVLDESNGEGWRGTDAMLDVVRRATEPDPDARYPSIAAFVEEWRGAVAGTVVAPR